MRAGTGNSLLSHCSHPFFIMSLMLQGHQRRVLSILQHHLRERLQHDGISGGLGGNDALLLSAMHA